MTVILCAGTPVSEMTYTVSSGTLNSSIPYHTTPVLQDNVDNMAPECQTILDFAAATDHGGGRGTNWN